MTSPCDESLILALDSSAATLERVGGKGSSLARLAAAGQPVPPGFHITTLAYRRFVDENQLSTAILSAAAQAKASDPVSLDGASAQIQAQIAQGTMPADIAALIRQWYGKLGTDDPAVAVRSSATAEDLPEMSFAGQQDTYLNVRGGDHVLSAVQRCWASLWTARALGYRARQGILPEDVALAVIVQQLVPANAAGVLFTANPLTGARDQMMINAAWGLGEAIVSGVVTPDTLVVHKPSGAFVSQEIADKQVMTVLVPQGTREEPVAPEKRAQPTLQPAQAAELARLGAQIEQLYGQPMDVEWAMQDGQIFIVQARPITALPEPSMALEWKLPQVKGRYARSSVIELLPDPLSPLFATVALPLWNAEYREMAKYLGFGRLMPDQFLVTINDYAYYDATGFASLSMLVVIPRLMLRAMSWMRRAQERWADEARPLYAAVVATWAARDLSATPATQLLDGAREIVRSAAGHYLTIQSGILPVAYMSETIFTRFYTRLIKRKDDPPALTFLLGFDSAPILAEKSLYDLATWARTQSELGGYLTRTPGAEIAATLGSTSAPIADTESWREFCGRFAEHLDRFGHAIYDLDFAKGLAADEPAPLLEALKYFLTGQARSPHERQATAEAARDQATQALLARRKGLRMRGFKRLLRWAQRYAPLREDALADVGLGWPLLRRMLIEIGQRLVTADGLADRNEVFWLKWDELETAARALDANQPASDSRAAVAERRALWEREAKVTPPNVFPIQGGARFMGIDFTDMMPARTDQAAGDTIKGVGSSPGRVTGEACVIHGPGEFSQMRQGDLLVAKITTPAWTPLFALAAGIVTDVGGPLSHSSIVAREYQIPAVLGTGVATERIRSGQRITVDGDAGVVKLSE
ncbi:MAG TPA: PEP/pyruvate-binding domain-containing protein [Isosphaeraceae bacterium]|jgi:pyruvate,water dikinase|nr:PEP/pyruvate-binding domain-containing protein [Isosphaeraceae bacterium]